MEEASDSGCLRSLGKCRILLLEVGLLSSATTVLRLWWRMIAKRLRDNLDKRMVHDQVTYSFQIALNIVSDIVRRVTEVQSLTSQRLLKPRSVRSD